MIDKRSETVTSTSISRAGYLLILAGKASIRTQMRYRLFDFSKEDTLSVAGTFRLARYLYNTPDS